jgi:hypothetical protein
MALFLTRVLAADGVLPVGLGFTITAWVDATNTISYDDAGTVKTVVYATTDTFAVGGVASTYANFEANISVGDKISFTGTTTKSFALTNVTTTGGLVNDANYAGDTFDIILASGPTLVDNQSFVPGGTNAYTVGGTAATQATFEANLSNGDTIAISGATPGTVTSPKVFALTNGTATGTVANVAAAVTWGITTAAGATLGTIDFDVPGGDALVLTVGGSAVTQAVFEAAATGLSNGDGITYSRASGIVTAALTNAAPAAVTGRVLTFDSGAANTISIAVGTATVAVPNYGVTTTLNLNGSGAVEADIDGAINIGDEVVYAAADAATSTTASVRLNDKTVSGTPVVLVTGGAGTVTIKFTSTGPASAAISTVTLTGGANIINVGLTGNTAVVYQINGTATTQGPWEAAVGGIIGGLSGTVTVSDSGSNTVWNVTSP